MVRVVKWVTQRHRSYLGSAFPLQWQKVWAQVKKVLLNEVPFIKLVVLSNRSCQNGDSYLGAQVLLSKPVEKFLRNGEKF